MKTSIADTPRDLSKEEKDNFGIEPFENGLVEFIKSTDTPITIALQGEWGSGKTSLMNSLQEKLVKKNNDFHSIWINTWEYSLLKDESSALLEIISKLIMETTKIAGSDDSRTKKMLGKVLNIGKTMAKTATKLAADKVVSGSSEIVENMFDKEELESGISEIRNELENIIDSCVQKNNMKGFLFFVDDLDRIDPPVAVQLLELLKNIFTLNNCVFILAIDYDVVIKGLEPKFGKLSAQNEREFRSFFDKIIQVPFSMPVSTYEINDFLKEKLFAINYFNAESFNNEKDNEELILQYSKIASLSVGTNPRSLKRLLNSLSLISCINKAKNTEENALESELEFFVNFALVSIQSAYPQVYRLLVMNPAFHNWNESTALQMNLKPLDEQSKEKLKDNEYFDEDWEQVLFRLCENDYYLKKRALDISTLLNQLKSYIEKNGEEIENTITSVISLSSVTNLEVETIDKPPIAYNQSWFLKEIRGRLFDQLGTYRDKTTNPIQVEQLGKKIVTNLRFLVKFKDAKGEEQTTEFTLSSTTQNGKITLQIFTWAWFCQSNEGLEKEFEKFGLLEKFQVLREEYKNLLPEKHKQKIKTYDSLGHPYTQHTRKELPHYSIHLSAHYELDSLEAFFTEEAIKTIALHIVTVSNFSVKLLNFRGEFWKLLETDRQNNS